MALNLVPKKYLWKFDEKTQTGLIDIVQTQVESLYKVGVLCALYHLDLKLATPALYITYPPVMIIMCAT